LKQDKFSARPVSALFTTVYRPHAVLSVTAMHRPRAESHTSVRAQVSTHDSRTLLVKIALLIEAVIQTRWYDSCCSPTRRNTANLSAICERARTRWYLLADRLR